MVSGVRSGGKAERCLGGAVDLGGAWSLDQRHGGGQGRSQRRSEDGRRERHPVSFR